MTFNSSFQTRGQPQKPESAGLLRHDTFTIGRSGVESNRPVIQQPVNREMSTQTPFYGSDLRAARSVDSSEPPRGKTFKCLIVLQRYFYMYCGTVVKRVNFGLM